jgi:hypothetical protein
LLGPDIGAFWGIENKAKGHEVRRICKAESVLSKKFWGVIKKFWGISPEEGFWLEIRLLGALNRGCSTIDKKAVENPGNEPTH